MFDSILWWWRNKLYDWYPMHKLLDRVDLKEIVEFWLCILFVYLKCWMMLVIVFNFYLSVLYLGLTEFGCACGCACAGAGAGACAYACACACACVCVCVCVLCLCMNENPWGRRYVTPRLIWIRGTPWGRRYVTPKWERKTNMEMGNPWGRRYVTPSG